MARFIVQIEANCDPTRDKDLNKWYEEIHIPDAIEFGCLSVTRCMNVNPGPGRGRFVALYEMESNDIDRSLKEIEAFMAKKRERGRSQNITTPVPGGGRAVLRKISEHTYKTFDYPRPKAQTG